MTYPKHIAIVMDGNSRWAKKRLLPNFAGHKAGLEAARKIVKACAAKKIAALSLFAFSSENWQRPKKEVDYLMDLFLNGLEKEVPMLHENNIKLIFIGSRKRFNQSLIDKIAEVESLTAMNKGMNLIIAIDYGGRWDICQAVNKILANHSKDSPITEHTIRDALSFAHLPEPDLFIRTSGEMRISNFMLWQLAYSELYFTDTLWPDFDEAALEVAFAQFAKRERRFGKRVS